MHDLIARYHEGLSDAVAQESMGLLTRRLHEDGLIFGERPLASVLRPRFLSTAQYHMIATTSQRVAAAMEKVRAVAMHDATVRAQFRLEPWEEALVQADPGLPVASPLSRFDAFLTPDGAGLKYTEYNAETPAGAGYNDALSSVYLDLPAMGAFRRHALVTPLPSAPGTVHTLLETYHAWRGVRELPSVAILDWTDVPTASEFRLFARHFERLGVPVIIGDPRSADYRDGVLRIDGTPVTLIYKRVLIDELIARCGIDSPVVRAVQEGAVCMVNPFRCKLLHKKASLAVVSDERYAPLFDDAEREAVAASVPWTRVVEERHTEYRAERVDLVPFLQAHREQLVLKPNDDYGGKGIVLGWMVSADAWDAAIRVALDTPYVAQERIVLPEEPFPTWVDGRLHIGARMVDTAPYLSHGLFMDGCLTRIATDPLLNVTAGGGSNIPTFLVVPR
jgi:hypothetical protein